MSTDVTTPTPRTAVGPRAFRLVIGWMLVAGALYLRWMPTGSWNFVDLTDFFYGGVSVREGVDLYAPRPGVLAFNYPPFAGAAFVPLVLLGLPVAKVAFTAATVIAYAVCIIAIRRAAQLSWGTALLVAAAGLALEPVVRTLVLGQIGIILMALVLADLFLVPPRLRGVLIGIAAGIKLTPALFVLFFVLRRDWKSAGRAAGTGLATVAVGWLASPESSRRYWLGGFDKLDRFGDLAFTPVNQSLTSFVARTTGHSSGATLWVALGVGGAVAVASAVVLARRGRWPAVAMTIAGATLLLSPISWTHHWVWVVPTLGLLVAARQFVATALVLVLFYVAPMWLVPQTGHLSAVQVVLAYAYLLGAVLLMLGVLVWHRTQRRGADGRS